MNLFGMLEVSGSALGAERLRAEVVAVNMANAETTRTPQGGPYRRKQVVFQSQVVGGFPRLIEAAFHSRQVSQGVRVAAVLTDPSPPEMHFDPSHPDANAQGYVAFPGINPVAEMADLMSAVRAYELNSSAVQATKQMIQQSIELLR
ncbi:MAG TPA: flagellar basal body rod protein FlgC [Terriglobales bacterium]|nr:flagellar basal body rod protein FlgC [Terriglobales bacterium]